MFYCMFYFTCDRSFTETIVRRQQISPNDLDDGSRLPAPDYRSTGSAWSAGRLIVARFIRTARHGARMTVMNAQDSRMIERPKREPRSKANGRAFREPNVTLRLMQSGPLIATTNVKALTTHRLLRRFTRRIGK